MESSYKKGRDSPKCHGWAWCFLCWITRVHQETFSSLFFLHILILLPGCRCWGIKSAPADCSSTQPQFRQRQSQLFPLISEHGVKCQLHPTSGRLRAPEDKLGKARVALGAGVSLTLSLCTELKYTQSSFQPAELGREPSSTSSP